METIELRPSKMKLLQAIAFLILGLAVFNYFAFVDKRFRGNLILEVAAVVTSVIILFVIYKFGWLFKRINKPIVTITNTSIQFYNKGSLVVCNWRDILAWEIIEESDSKFLVLKTEQGVKQIEVSNLDKSPAQIRNIIERLK